jgi:hypothetical protein
MFIFPAVLKFSKTADLPEAPLPVKRKTAIKICTEEIQELLEAKETEDIIDAIGDIVYATVYGYHMLTKSLDLIWDNTWKNVASSYGRFETFKYFMAMHRSRLNGLLDTEKDAELGNELRSVILLAYYAGSEFVPRMDGAIREIHRANMSKFCVTEKEAIKSVEAYKDSERYTNVKYKKSGDLWVIYNDGQNYKILKSINFTPPDLRTFKIDTGYKLDVVKTIEDFVDHAYEGIDLVEKECEDMQEKLKEVIEIIQICQKATDKLLSISRTVTALNDKLRSND